MTEPEDDGYLLANAQAEAGRRFDVLTQLFDPVTSHHLGSAGASARRWPDVVPTWCSAGPCLACSAT
jgi:hypothetical protein